MGRINSVTNLGSNGVADWLAQRVTAYILALYTIVLLFFIIANPGMSHETWAGFFSQTWVRIFSLLALLSVGAHSWIGLWTVTTDYIKSALQRFLVQAACGLTLFVYVVWGIQILWGF